MNKLMKHENCSEVAAKFLKIEEVPEGFNVIVSWYNIVNPQNIREIGLLEEVLITKEQMPSWKVYG